MLYAEKVGLSAVAQCESLRYKLLDGMTVLLFVSEDESLWGVTQMLTCFSLSGHAMVCFDLLWNQLPRDVRLSYLASFALFMPS
jgi:hypothetical protein